MALNFPSNPSDGDIYENFSYDATAGVWRRIPSISTINSFDDVLVDTPLDGQALVYDETSGDWINGDVATEVYDVNSTSNGYFALPSGTDVQRPANPVNGNVRFNSESGEPEWYSGELETWFKFREQPSLAFDLQYLVIAGGGGAGGCETNYSGGNWWGGGGGAGGYRSSINGESSGGGSTAESYFSADLNSEYTVSVGAGGPGGPAAANVGNNGTPGSTSSFDSISSTGGGYGGGGSGVLPAGNGGTGGSGGGGGSAYQPAGGSAGSGGLGTTAQGYAGIEGVDSVSPYSSGGGGGAGSSPASTGRYRGDGLASTVTGSSVTRAIGGYGGTSNAANTNGPNNSGNGGDTASVNNGSGKSGGSGVVILKYPSAYTLNVGAGLTSTTFTIGDYKVTQFTAGSDTVTFS